MLEIKNITKVFNLTGNDEDKKIALNDVSITINDGDFITIIGGNGSGKSTLMNIIAGVFPPDSGDIILDGVSLNKLSEYKRAKYLGRVFQDPMLGTASNMSVLENLEIAYRRGNRQRLVWGFKKEHVKIFEQELIKFDLGLEQRLGQKVGLLSGGQRQALTLLMATIKKPKLLLLDEHTAALDPKTADKVLVFTDKIVKEHNLTTLMITHNMADALHYGNRLIMLNEGKVILDVANEEKSKLTVEALLSIFKESKNVVLDDKMILG